MSCQHDVEPGANREGDNQTLLDERVLFGERLGGFQATKDRHIATVCERTDADDDAPEDTPITTCFIVLRSLGLRLVPAACNVRVHIHTSDTNPPAECVGR